MIVCALKHVCANGSRCPPALVRRHSFLSDAAAAAAARVSLFILLIESLQPSPPLHSFRCCFCSLFVVFLRVYNTYRCRGPWMLEREEKTARVQHQDYKRCRARLAILSPAATIIYNRNEVFNLFANIALGERWLYTLQAFLLFFFRLANVM